MNNDDEIKKADEIVRALRCCGNTDTKRPDCEHCPLLSTRMCVKVMLEGAADLIESLQAQLAAERAKYAELQHYNVDCTKQCGTLIAEKINLKEQLAERNATLKKITDDTARLILAREQLQDDNAKLRNQLAASQRRERAAVEDIPHMCEFCNRIRCADCNRSRENDPYTATGDYWQWRGPQEAGKGEAE